MRKSSKVRHCTPTFQLRCRGKPSRSAFTKSASLNTCTDSFSLVSKKRLKSKTFTTTCVVCSFIINGNESEINEHVESCLAGRCLNSNIMEEYEWNGECRIRLSPTGLFGMKNSVKEECNLGSELNIAEDEEALFGAAQFTDSDMILSKVEHDGIVFCNESRAPLTPASSGPSSPAAEHFHSSSTILIESLKSTIRTLEETSRNAPKCVLCQEHYKNPCVNIGCWHVYCQECWMMALGSRKTCPQCSIITKPTDLRRIYL